MLDIAEVALTEQLVMHGYVAEMLDMILSPMARVGQEPLGGPTLNLYVGSLGYLLIVIMKY